MTSFKMQLKICIASIISSLFIVGNLFLFNHQAKRMNVLLNHTIY